MLEIEMGHGADSPNELELQQLVWKKWDPNRDTEGTTHNVERAQNCIDIWHNYISKRLGQKKIATVILREESGAHMLALDIDEVRKILGLIANTYKIGIETTTIEKSRGRFEETMLLIKLLKE